jgi:hypothetical protein
LKIPKNKAIHNPFLENLEMIRPITIALKANTSVTELDISFNQLDAEACHRIAEDITANEALSTFTFCGNGGVYGTDGDAVTLDARSSEVVICGAKLGAAGCSLIAAFLLQKSK